MSEKEDAAMFKAMGDFARCARKGCASVPSFRLILGKYDAQVYVCRRDLMWGIELNALTEARITELGFGFNVHDGVRYEGPGVKVIPEPKRSAGHKPMNYARDVRPEVSQLYPVMEGRFPSYHLPVLARNGAARCCEYHRDRNTGPGGTYVPPVADTEGEQQ